jgi:hypothetical protein
MQYAKIIWAQEAKEQCEGKDINRSTQLFTDHMVSLFPSKVVRAAQEHGVNIAQPT